jgi:hypothetical protein
MQTFHITDALRCTLANAPKGPNLACPRESSAGWGVLRPATLWREALAQPRDRITLVSWDGMRPQGLVSARIRAGHRVWEVDRLYLADVQSPVNERPQYDQAEASPLQLLEHLIEAAGMRQAERVFLRLPSDSPVVTMAQRAGLFPYYEESLLVRPDRGVHHNGAATLDGLRERLPEDDYPLFQLFSGATPQQARVALGLTFDQWRDAQETHHRSRCDWVTERNGRLTGWLSLWSWDGQETGEVLAHPDHPESLSALVHLAIARRGTTRWWVPGYQEMTKSLLLHQGFQEIARYFMLIKTMAVRALSHGMAPVEA